jgi:hypothetical protein
VQLSFNTGAVAVASTGASSLFMNGTTNSYTGGLIGEYVGGTILNDYNQGNVTGIQYVGGLIGGINVAGSITNTYSSGLVTGFTPPGNTPTVGGLVGYQNASYTTVINGSFWDNQVSTQTATAKNPNGSALGVGLPTALMQQQSTYAGWTFGGPWYISSGNYPTFTAPGFVLSVAAAFSLLRYLKPLMRR